jgi:hypothetical protein
VYFATDRTAGQAGCVESARENPQGTTYSVLSHVILADSSISQASKLILLALLKFARQKGECFPALATLGRAAGISESTVRRHLDKLVEAGLLSIRPTKSNPTGRVIVLDFTHDPARHPALRVSNRQPSLGCQTAPALRVSNRPVSLGCQTDAPVRTVEEKEEKKREFSPSLQRQRSEAAALQLDLIGTVAQTTAPAFTPPRPAVPQDEPITLHRAKTVMEFTLKGGRLREGAAKYLTPAMIAFMKAQDGELRAFANTYSPTTAAPTPSFTPASSFAPPSPPAQASGVADTRIAAVMETAAAIDRRSSPLLVDRLADRLMMLFRDGGSRGFFCGIGHALRNGSLDPRALRDALTTSFGPGVNNPSALFTSRIGARLGERKART